MTLPSQDAAERLARLQALEIAARASGLVADLINGTHVRIHTKQVSSVWVNVRCALRGDDFGRPWFADGDHWLKEADDIVNTLVAVKGILPSDASRPEPGRVPGRDAP